MKLRLEGVEFGYVPGQCLFRIPGLDIEAGASVGIVGPSGIGKTSFLKTLSGICATRCGSILLGDVDMCRLGEAQRRRFRNERIGLVFQDFRLLDYLSVRDNMLLPSFIGVGATSRQAVADRVDGLIQTLGLTDRFHAAPRELSQGEQQRVAIGRALLTRPQLVLADEPTGNLDERNKERVRDLLVAYGRDHGATVVMVTHDPQLLTSFDRVIDFAAYQMTEART